MELTVSYVHSLSVCTATSGGGCLCASDETVCNGLCSDFRSDPQNCGGCTAAGSGAICGSGSWCISGVCQCPGTETACSSACTDTNVDPHNCGACGAACTVAQVCSGGQCTGAQPVSLASSFNRTGIVWDGTVFVGGLDAGGTAYSANLLGSALVFGGTTMLSGPPNAPGAVSGTGQAIALPAGQFSTLKMLATGVLGNQTAQAFQVSYTSGSPTAITQSLSDWHTPQSYAGETVAQAMSYRDLAAGTRDTAAFSLYGYSFAIDNTRTVSTLTLPANANVEVLAVTLVP
jgi:hypothetical protein